MVDRRQPASDEGNDEQGEHDRRPGHRQDDERQAARCQSDLGRDEQPATVDRIGQRAATEREQQDRHQLEELERGDRERRTCQDIDLERQGDPRDLVADAVDDLAGPQPPVVAVPPKRSRVEEDPTEPTSGSVGHGVPGGYLSRSAPARTACAAASRATGTRNGEHDT